MSLPKVTKLSHPPAGNNGRACTEPSPPLPAAMPDGQPWPRISIVTLSYNQGEFIEEAIRSVLLQNYPNLEYIVIDGGSTDDSVEIIEKYADCLAYWCSQRDAGPAVGLNKGFKRANGEIYAFLNADDFYLPGSLHRIATLFRAHPSVDVLYGDGYWTEVSGRLRKPIYSDAWSLWRLAYGTCVLVQQATFLRKEAFQLTDGFNEQNSTCWDAGLWADLALAGARFHHEREFFGVFRVRPDSISRSRRFRHQFRRDMNLIFQRIIRRQRRASDYALELLLRLLKFSSHPHRTLGYKLFLHSIRNQSGKNRSQSVAGGQKLLRDSKFEILDPASRLTSKD